MSKMNLEQQVCSLEYAKKLKELGVKQDSLFYWYECYNWDTCSELIYLLEPPKFSATGIKYSAFTVAELGEILPCKINEKDAYLTFLKYEDFYISKYIQWRYWDIEESFYLQEDITEANVRTKMLICLIENGLVKV